MNWTSSVALLFFLFSALFSSGSIAAPIERLADVVVPSPHAFRGWEDIDYTNVSGDVFALPRKPFNCPDTHLYPTHPQQASKYYHEYQRGHYDNTRLAGNTPGCTMSSVPNRDGRSFCSQPDAYDTAVVSDIFVDSCGNYYRGVWRKTFFTSHDNMGMLASLGRAIWDDPSTEYSRDTIEGSTHPVDASEFMFFTPLLTVTRTIRGERRVIRDSETIEQLREASMRTHRFDPATRTYRRL